MKKAVFTVIDNGVDGKEKDLQLLMFDKRMKFGSPDGRDNSKITFSSSYFCWNFLPKQIMMKELKTKTNC